jgi:hypothetical protein
MSIIRGVRRPKRSARIPKMRAPTGRMASVSVTANKTAGSPTLNSFAIRSVTKVTRKKSKASSDQPRKLARKVYRCSRERDRIKLHAPMNCHSFIDALFLFLNTTTTQHNEIHCNRIALKQALKQALKKRYYTHGPLICSAVRKNCPS